MFARIGVAALAFFAISQGALAQTGADPTLCSSIKSIMSKTPKTAWPDKPNVTLEWDGGSNACVTVGAGVLSCDFFHTQMASADLCKIYRDADMEQVKRDVAGRQYAGQRAMAALQACFTGATSEPWKVQMPNRVTNGMTVKLPDGSSFRFGESSSRIELADSICGYSSVGFEFDPAK